MAVSGGSPFSLELKSDASVLTFLGGCCGGRGGKAILEAVINGSVNKRLLPAMTLTHSLGTFLESSCLEQLVSAVLIYWFKCCIVPRRTN